MTFKIQKWKFLSYLFGTHLDSARRGGATVWKVGGTKRDLYPPHLEKWGYNFLHVRGTSKQITISIEYTEICCLVVVWLGLYYRPGRPIMNQRRRQFHVLVVNNIGTACMHQVQYSSWNSVTCIEQSKKTSKDCLLCCRNRGVLSMLSMAQDAAWIK